ncbi:bifunctional diaminohydroxyphosphoribosylaminopyrimidine deaminase/5-amino-6-(5-phosphoribosylamino)uracil reductase RibD [Microbacteriaceae bacterium 4G12]
MMTDQEYMKLALELTKATTGQTSPNPMVGAVVVNNGRIVGLGTHLQAGQAHAEVHALLMAGDKAGGSTVYVTLEPCSHYGKTPPCCNLLIEKKVKRVVIATLDHNPLVRGHGVKKLREAGIDVEVGVLEKEATTINKAFFHYMKTKTPYVTLKTAMSLDGKIATSTGESKWITGEEARRDVHVYRHQNDGILVGVNTVIADNPSLTTRLPNGGRHPIRIILDTHLRTPLVSKVLTDDLAPTWIITGAHISTEQRKLYESSNVQVLSMSTELISIQELLYTLGEKGILSLFVEGGQSVHASFLEEGYFQELITYINPKLIGGQNAPTFFGGNGFPSLQDATLLHIQSIEQMGQDIKIVAVPRNEVQHVYRNR